MNETRLSKLFISALVTIGLIVGVPTLSTESSAAESLGWVVEGEGHCFEVTNSTYLNVTLCSTELVNVTLESVPEVVSFAIRAVGTAASTEIMLSGFVPNGTYYRHVDGHLVESFVPDEAGNYSYTQDLTTPHHVFIAEESGTKYITDTTNGGDCYLIGTWDGPTKTCTLTKNVYEMIVLDSDGLTLDGDGRSVSGSFSYGIYAFSKSGLTVENVVVSGPTYGMRLRSTGSTVSGNTVFGSYYGIFLWLSSGSTVSGNTIWGSFFGIHLSSSSSSIVSGNTVSVSDRYSYDIYLSNSDTNTITGNSILSGYYGIFLSNSDTNTITGNSIVEAHYGMVFLSTSSNTVSGNAISSEYLGISMRSSANDAISGNTISGSGLAYAFNLQLSSSITLSGNAMTAGGIAISGDSLSHWNTHIIDATNTVDGRPVQYYKDTTGVTIPSGAGQVILANCSNMIVENHDISDVSVGVVVVYGSGNTIRWNTVTGVSHGIIVRYSSATLSGNTVSASSYGIQLSSSSGSTVTSNTVSDATWGIALYSSGGNTITGNTVSSDGYGIYQGSSDDNTFTDNTVTVNGNYGIYIWSSVNATLTDNSMNKGGIVIEGASAEYWNTHTIDATNTVGGNPVQYCKNTAGGTIPIGAGQVILANCSNMIVENHDISNVYMGIVVIYGSGNTIRRSTIVGSFHGIYIRYSDTGTVTENTVSASYYGIEISSSSGSTVSRNSVTVDGSRGIYLGSSGGSTVTENTVSANVDGIELYYSGGSTVTENTVSASSYGIELSSSGGSTVTGNRVLVTGGQYGIYVSPASGSAVKGNMVTGGEYGIKLSSSGDSMIVGNAVVGSTHGIYLYSISTGTISGNTVKENTYGLSLYYSSGNEIFHNNFIDNANQFYSLGSTNTWNNPAHEGNYWSDYTGVDDGSGGRIAGDGIGDTNLPHQGVDWYPLMQFWYNPPEILSVSGPNLVQIGDVAVMTGTFVDVDMDDTHTALWSWNDGSPDTPGLVMDGTVTGSHYYISAGVYTVVLTVMDNHDASDTMQYQYVVVYDPHGAFVTGGGWIDSPPDAYIWDPGLTGKATFGFVAKYLRGNSIPTGETEFHFQLADIHFTSDSYDWLVCGGPKCKFKGQGTFTVKRKWGGPWDREYAVRFMITVVDGSLPGGGGKDKFRIKIWDLYSEFVYYDNMRGWDDEVEPPEIGGGNIVIHKG